MPFFPKKACFLMRAIKFGTGFALVCFKRDSICFRTWIAKCSGFHLKN